MSKRRFVTFILTCVLAGLACSSGDVLPGKPGPTPILTATQNSLVRGGPGGDSLSIKETATANALSTDIAQATASAQTTPPGPVSGSIELDGGACCAGGDTGNHIEIFAEISAESEAAFVSDMRLAYNYGSDAIDLENAPWETRSTEASFPIQLISNWVGFTACVQFRDQAGNLSEVYCDEISVEGMPAMPSPLLQLEYDLYWMTGGFGDLMRLDHETQEVSCLVGELSECDFVIEGGVRDYDFNNDRSKLLINIFPPVKDDEFEKLALLDLQSSEFRIFHEIDEFAGLYDLVFSPDGMWAAYQQNRLVDYEDGRRQEVITIRIVSTSGIGPPVYELECNDCRIPDLSWSFDSQHLAFGGFDDLWIVTNNGGIWESSKFFTEDLYKYHKIDNWSSQYNLLLTNQWVDDKPEPDLGYYYLLDPLQGSYVELFQRRQGPRAAIEGWLDGDTLIRIDPVVWEKYVQESILFLTKINPDSVPLELSTEQYKLSFEHRGFPFQPSRISETEIAFSRITEMPDGSYRVETYAFDTSTEELTPGVSCLFHTEESPFFWRAVWSPDKDLLISKSNGDAFILSANGLGCINLNLLLGGDFEKLDWAP